MRSTRVFSRILCKKHVIGKPIEDGKTFWKKFGFKENGKLSIREKIE